MVGPPLWSMVRVPDYGTFFLTLKHIFSFKRYSSEPTWIVISQKLWGDPERTNTCLRDGVVCRLMFDAVSTAEGKNLMLIEHGEVQRIRS
jgi:hypothetical protein